MASLATSVSSKICLSFPAKAPWIGPIIVVMTLICWLPIQTETCKNNPIGSPCFNKIKVETIRTRCLVSCLPCFWGRKKKKNTFYSKNCLQGNTARSSEIALKQMPTKVGLKLLSRWFREILFWCNSSSQGAKEKAAAALPKQERRPQAICNVSKTISRTQ